MATSILIICPDVITERMAGPAIRYWEFAKSLTTDFTVTLAAVNDIPDTLKQQAFDLVHHHQANIDSLVAQHDIIILQGYVFEFYPQLKDCQKILIADLYDPLPLEGLEQHTTPEEDNARLQEQTRVINDQIKRADYFLCASDRQRDLWLGHLLTLGRINPHTYADMQQRIVTIPFGLPDALPKKTGAGLRQQLDTEKAFVLLWGGGIWEWFDPLVIIHAIHQLLPRYPDLRLIFLGTKHPNPGIPIMPMQHKAEMLAKELGMYNKQIIFQPGWVAYEALQNYLLEADVGVSAHFNTLETHFSFRTRILYYLWAGKPIITTKGDILADMLTAHHAGIVVDYEDEKAWMAAIEQLHDPEYYAILQKGIQQLAQHYTWSRVTQPLKMLCQNAKFAPDMLFEQGRRRLMGWDCEQAYHDLNAYVHTIEHSHSWKITAPLRNVRRWLSRSS